MTDNVVEFVVAEFREDYPMFSALSDNKLQRLFNSAVARHLRNDARSCVRDLTVRKEFLYLIVAHLATLFQRAQSGNEIVGRLSSASEGSVSISSEYNSNPLGGEKWWVQTTWGAEYWISSAPYRTATAIITNFPMYVDRRGTPRR